MTSRDSPGIYFLALTIINVMNFVDRGIIPGATDEFTSFIDRTLHTDTPSLYIGLLQSSFIIGLCIASPIFATLSHRTNIFTLIGYGMSCWTVAAFISGLAFFMKSYEVLVIGRVLSGAGEAAFMCCTAPWIATNADADSKSRWLATFYLAMPVGTALGYIYSSIIATSIGWKWAFFIEAIYMIPFVAFLFAMAYRFPVLKPGERHFPAKDYEDNLLNSTDKTLSEQQFNGNQNTEENGTDQSSSPSLWEETRLVCAHPCYVYITFGYAALTAVLIGLATFGSSFFLGLGLFESEVAASTAFGIIVSIAGIIGFPVGGVLVDFLSAQRKKNHPESAEADLVSSSLVMLVSGTIGLVLYCSFYFTRGIVLALGVIFLATFAIFICNAATSIGLIYSIPVANRSFGIAFNVIVQHMLGDVPSPLVAGYLKDHLANGCVGDDDKASTSDACRDDAPGIRLTMLLISLWLLWCTVFYGAAYVHALSIDFKKDKTAVTTESTSRELSA
mmetsp:Transcript_15282/g.23013  ORF Transcript_15282/g.23013 Transcript_15282/m.23013 type:complete len:503 (-) Transcript_15282:176-1684(-)